MALSAADLQKRHQLEGAPDPFPSLAQSPVKATAFRQQQPKQQQLDTDSQSAFPSLAPAAAAAPAPAKPTWGATAGGPRIKPTVIVRAPVFADSITLSSIDLSNNGKDGKAATLGEVIKQVTAKYKIKIDASTTQKTRETTFHLKADNQKELDKAKRSLLALLSPVITLVINAPASTIASIIGQKGATLKQIRDQTSVRVDIPPRSEISNGNGASSGKATPSNDDDDDDDEEPTVPVTLTGSQPLVYEAQALLNVIISAKTSKSTQRVRDIPSHILPFIVARKAQFEAAAQGGAINLALKAADREITVSGDREAVTRVIESIKASVEGFKSSLTSIKMQLPKGQHRLLVGKAVDQILAKSQCTVVVAGPEDPSLEVTVWGQGTDLPKGLGAVMEQANSQHILEFPVSSQGILTYFSRIQYPKTITAAHPGVSVYSGPSRLDIVGEKSAVDAAARQIKELTDKLASSTKEVPVDWLLHRVITGKNAKKIKLFHESNNVLVYFPAESAESSNILLVYDPLSSTASSSSDEKKKNLEAVSQEILKLVKESPPVKSETIAVDKKWHDAVNGRSGTTLNAIIGEDKTLSIKIGKAADAATEDFILIRGIGAEVDRVVAKIGEIVERAKNDEIEGSYSAEFDIDREFVGRVVGANGAGLNKLRDQLDVKVDVSDDHHHDDKEKDFKKKKAVPNQKSKVTITGRKENVEDAKKRIYAQLERLADETSEVLKIPAQYHSSLIGQSGKYAIRLEEKYSVKITFPRQSADNSESKTREQLKSDEVLIKGGKKGVAGAKSEIMEAVDFEKESNNVIKFTVPTRSVARILGKGGASINDIKDETSAQIDVDKSPEEKVTNITLTGTKKAVAAAKALIMAIADQVHEEITVTVTVENKFHRTLIGPGGSNLKEFVTKNGGPEDPKLQAGLIHFPRNGEPGDEVRLRGEPALVNKLKVELEKVVAALRDRVIIGVDIPAAQHRTFIGRGGQHLNDLQNRTGVQVQFPGSRSYSHVGPPENPEDLENVDAANIVKVTGPRSNVETAIAELKGQIKAPAPDAITATVSVPLKYHTTISQQGSFFRTLRNIGVQVDQSAHPKNSSTPQPPAVAPSAAAASARIDEDTEQGAVTDHQWQVTPNYQDAEEGDSQWTLKAKDDAALAKAQKLISDAIENAAKLSHVGLLTLPDRSTFPRIVGTKGSNVSRIRQETGADVVVSRETNTIVITGSESSIVAAKDNIIRMVSAPARAPRRYQD